MKISLIALDLDGTALRPDHLTISGSLRKALREAESQGILAVPVTGRPYALLPPCLLGHPRGESYAILSNGAELRDLRTGAVLSRDPLQKQQVLQVLKIAEEFDLPAELNCGGTLYLTKASLEKERQEPKLLFHCNVFLKEHGTVTEDLKSCSHLAPEKIHLNCIPQEKWQAVRQALDSLNVSVVCEKPPNLEVTHENATKGKGLLALCRRLGISPESVLAIGDSGNDLTMLEAAGISVAMATAPDFLKAAADYVTGSNLQDGAAEAIRRFALT